MKNLMRLTAVVMMLAVLLCLAACGGGEPTTPATQKPTNKPTTAPTTAPTTVPTSTGFVVPEHTYKVKVVDQNGDIVVGATVQFCLESCMFKPTEQDGYAYFNVEVKDGYKAQIIAAPEGYSFDPELIVYLEPGQTELTLTITKN